MRVFCCSYAPHLAVCHYRLALPAAALLGAGHQCWLGSAVITGRGAPVGVLPNGDLASELDLIVLQPGLGQDLATQIQSAQRYGCRVVVDLDDWAWDVPESNQARRDPNFERSLEALYRTVMAADLVTVSTPYLAERLGEWPAPPPVRVLRNAIDLSGWGDPETVSDGPVIGYAGNMNEHAEDVALLRPWLGRFLERHDLRLVHVGAHPNVPPLAQLAGLPPTRVVERPGVAWAKYRELRPMAGMDVGLVPLADRPYNQAKSALKGMEYATCGVPFLASRSPEYEWFDAGVPVGDGLGNQDSEAWEEALTRLLDPIERVRAAEAGRRRVSLESSEVRGDEWVTVYRELLGV
jgi:Glycosyl transferases group 1